MKVAIEVPGTVDLDYAGAQLAEAADALEARARQLRTAATMAAADAEAERATRDVAPDAMRVLEVLGQAGRLEALAVAFRAAKALGPATTAGERVEVTVRTAEDAEAEPDPELDGIDGVAPRDRGLVDAARALLRGESDG